MRMSLWLAAVVLCLGVGSSARAGGIFSLNPFSSSSGNSNSGNNNTFSGASSGVNIGPSNATSPSPSPGASQAKFPSPGQSLSGPSRLIDLIPNLHGLTNTHVIGYSVYPTQTDQYLAQFGFQRIR
jgi:hypothetical protein